MEGHDFLAPYRRYTLRFEQQGDYTADAVPPSCRGPEFPQPQFLSVIC
jgi:hypothetical protein